MKRVYFKFAYTFFWAFFLFCLVAVLSVYDKYLEIYGPVKALLYYAVILSTMIYPLAVGTLFLHEVKSDLITSRDLRGFSARHPYLSSIFFALAAMMFIWIAIR